MHPDPSYFLEKLTHHKETSVTGHSDLVAQLTDQIKKRLMLSVLLYIDPGSGSYLVQVIIAALVGIAVYFKSIRMRIKSFFTRNKKENISQKDSQ